MPTMGAERLPWSDPSRVAFPEITTFPNWSTRQ